MIQHTKEDIIKFLRTIWPDCGDSKRRSESVNASINADYDNGLVEIEITSMYDPPGLSYEILESFANFFDTKHIDCGAEIHESGCESCDYGSKHGYTLIIKEGD